MEKINTDFKLNDELEKSNLNFSSHAKISDVLLYADTGHSVLSGLHAKSRARPVTYSL